jgi:hypothetical protein
MSGGGNLPVGPGIWGFIAFFVLAIALWFLVRNMNNRLRRMAYRDRDRAEEFAASADADGSKPARSAAEGPEAAGPAGDGRAADRPAPESPTSEVPREPGDDAGTTGEGSRP